MNVKPESFLQMNELETVSMASNMSTYQQPYTIFENKNIFLQEIEESEFKNSFLSNWTETSFFKT